MSRAKIAPVKRSLRIMDGIGGDGKNNSLPDDLKSRYLKVNDGIAHIEGMETVSQVQEHRDETDKLLLRADETLLKISTNQLFLPTYYSKENTATARTHSNVVKSPRHPATARQNKSHGRGTQGEPRQAGSQSARGADSKMKVNTNSEKPQPGTVALPPICNRKGQRSKYFMRNQCPVSLESESDKQLNKVMEEEARQQQSLRQQQQQQHHHHRGHDEEDDDGASDAQANNTMVRQESMQLNNTNRAAGAPGDAGGASHNPKPRGSATVSPWWDLSDLDEGPKQLCRDQLVKAPETCKVSWADFEYRARDFVNNHPDAEAYDFCVEREVVDALGGTAYLKDMMEAVGSIEHGLSLVSDPVMSSDLTGLELRDAAEEIDTGLLEILEDAAGDGGIHALSTQGLDEELLFHWDLRLVPKGKRLLKVRRIRTKALAWLQTHFERVDADLRADFEAK